MDLVGREIQRLGGRNRRTEDAEHLPRVKAARHHRRDKVLREPVGNLIAGSDRGQVLPAGALGFLGDGQGCRQHQGARVNHEPEGIPFATGHHHLGVHKGRSGATQLHLMPENAGVARACAIVFHDRQRLLRVGELAPDQGRGQALKGCGAGAVDDGRRQVFEAKLMDPLGELAAEALCHVRHIAPPSTATEAPVMKLARAEARNTATAATSCGCP